MAGSEVPVLFYVRCLYGDCSEFISCINPAIPGRLFRGSLNPALVQGNRGILLIAVFVPLLGFG